MNCLLCSQPSVTFFSVAFQCPSCSLVFKNPAEHLSSEEESRRYSFHQNSDGDSGYVKFLERLIKPLEQFLPKEFTALDFGCGPGPTLCKLLEVRGGKVENYDPIFLQNKSLLERSYQVVTATEVVEHFKQPARDWALLAQLVEPGGILGVMTQFLLKDVDYQNWWYKNDPTHVVFYNQKTFHHIEQNYQLEKLFDDGHSVVIFRKKS